MFKSAFSDSKEPKQRATNLLFLIDSKILDGLDTRALRKWAEDNTGDTPAFDSGSTTVNKGGIEREFRIPPSPGVVADLTKKATESGSLAWMQHAIAELGVTEIPGPDNNVRIMEYARFTGIQLDAGEETPWAGLFVNFVLKKAGFGQFPSSPLANRAWATWGEAIEQPKFGALAVLWRVSPQSGFGHVGFVVGFDDTSLSILGGNQRDSVSVDRFPRDRLLTLRVPSQSARATAP